MFILQLEFNKCLTRAVRGRCLNRVKCLAIFIKCEGPDLCIILVTCGVVLHICYHVYLGWVSTYLLEVLVQ